MVIRQINEFHFLTFSQCHCIHQINLLFHFCNNFRLMKLLGINVIAFAFHILIAVKMILIFIILCQATRFKEISKLAEEILYPDSFFKLFSIPGFQLNMSFLRMFFIFIAFAEAQQFQLIAGVTERTRLCAGESIRLASSGEGNDLGILPSY